MSIDKHFATKDFWFFVQCILLLFYQLLHIYFSLYFITAATGFVFFLGDDTKEEKKSKKNFFYVNIGGDLIMEATLRRRLYTFFQNLFLVPLLCLFLIFFPCTHKTYCL
jgi:hypothetical protein